MKQVIFFCSESGIIINNKQFLYYTVSTFRLLMLRYVNIDMETNQKNNYQSN